jgi:hypothetical protein
MPAVRHVVFAVALCAVGCRLDFEGAPCVSDANCPDGQRCRETPTGELRCFVGSTSGMGGSSGAGMGGASAVGGSGGGVAGLGGATGDEDGGLNDGGAGLVLRPGALTFAGPRGAPTPSQLVSVTNTGVEATGPLSIALSDSTFTTTTTCGEPLGPQGSCDIAVTFRPTNLGQVSARLTVSDDAGVQAFAGLTGTGLAPAAISAMPTTLDFGPQPLGVVARRAITVTNTGGVVSQPISALLAGDAEFATSASNPVCPPLDAGSSCQVEIAFTPTTETATASTLTLRSGSAPEQRLSVSGSGVSPPVLSLMPSTPLNLGALVVGQLSTPVALTLRNTGGSTTAAAPTVTFTSVIGATFSASGCQQPLSAGEPCMLLVSATANTPGSVSAMMTLRAGTASATVSIGGTAARPATLVWEPAAGHDFGSVPTNGTGVNTFVLRNTGGLNSGTPVISLTNQSAFQVASHTCTAALTPNGTCTVTVSFSPPSQSSFSASLEANAMPGGPVATALRGIGDAPSSLTVSAAAPTFPPTPVQQTSLLRFTVNGSAISPLMIMIVGQHAGDFSVASNGCTGPILPCSFDVQFRPTGAGSRSAIVVVTAASTSGTAPLSGRGQAPAQLRFRQASLAFPDTVRGQTSLPQQVILENVGDLLAGQTMLASTGGSEFPVQSMCPVPLAGGASCTLDITFTPTTTGTRAATLTASSMPGASTTLNLSGIGLAPARLEATPSSFAFDPVEVNTSSAPRTVTITNSGQERSGPLSFSGATAFNVSPGAGANACMVSATLAAGASCTIEVVFRPTTLMAVREELVFSATPGQAAVVTVTGTGATPPQLVASTNSKDLGLVRIGSTVSFVWSIDNTGGLPSSPISLSVLTEPYAVTADGCSNQTLAAGSSCSVTVRFAPVSGGSAQQSLTASATRGGSNTVALSGAGGRLLTVTPPTMAGVTIRSGNGALVCTSVTRSCSSLFAPGTSVTLVGTTSNGSGFFFKGWALPNDCDGRGRGRQCSFTLMADTTVSADFEAITGNLAFVSSVTLPANLGGVAPYDAQCNQLATDAGINSSSNNAYRAWISTAASPANNRLTASGGFMRLDGEVIADSRTSLLNGSIRAPIDVDEFGVKVLGALSTWTGTASNGTHRPGQDCMGWSINTATVFLERGLVRGGPGLWTEGSGGHTCDNAGTRVYCLMNTSNSSLRPAPVPDGGAIAYVTDNLWTPGSGRASADNHCATNKPNNFATGRTYVALVSTTTEAAAARLPINRMYYSPQGTFLFNSDQLKTLASPQLFAGMWMTGNETFVSGPQQVYTGAARARDTASLAAPNCNDWTSSASSGSTLLGQATVASENYFNSFGANNGCSQARRLLCVQQ